MTAESARDGVPAGLELTEEEVLERFRWAARRGRPEHLWPGVSTADLRNALAEIERVTTAAVRGDPAVFRTGGAGARVLGIAGYVSGAGPLIGHWLESGAVEGTDPVRRIFALHLSHGRRRAERLDGVLHEAVEALARHGIRHPLVVKGSHTARAYFLEPGARPALDVDLVVPGGALDPAERALEESDHRLGVRERRPRKSTWLAPGASRLPRSVELLHADSQYAVEIHGSLERNFFGVRTLGPARAAEVASRPAPELGAAVRVLTQPELLFYHALHASEGLYHLTLVRAVELVLMIRKDTAAGTLDWRAFRELVEGRRAGRFLFPALTMAERLAPGTVEPATLEALRAAAPERMRRVVAARSPGRAWRHDVVSLDEKFMWCATPLDYLRRAIHMAVLPSSGRWPRRLAAKYRERLFRIGRGTVAVTGPEEDPPD